MDLHSQIFQISMTDIFKPFLILKIIIIIIPFDNQTLKGSITQSLREETNFLRMQLMIQRIDLVNDGRVIHH